MFINSIAADFEPPKRVRDDLFGVVNRGRSACKRTRNRGLKRTVSEKNQRNDDNDSRYHQRVFNGTLALFGF